MLREEPARLWLRNPVAALDYDNPTIMLERQPGSSTGSRISVFTGLLFVAATLLLYEMLGMELAS